MPLYTPGDIQTSLTAQLTSLPKKLSSTNMVKFLYLATMATAAVSASNIAKRETGTCLTSENGGSGPDGVCILRHERYACVSRIIYYMTLLCVLLTRI